MVLITHPRDTLLSTGPTHVIRGQDEIRVRVWSTHPLAGVRGRIDEGEWIMLRQVAPIDWVTKLDSEAIGKGVHRLTIEACDREGSCGQQTITFPVDPTGRYTAVPAVWPVVTSTKFC